MKMRPATRLSFLLLALALLLPGCGSLPGSSTPGNAISPNSSHKFQCHPASPGQCSYAIFNESGSVRETFTLAPGEAHEVANILPRTKFCLAVEKPLDPSKCQRLGLDGKPAK
ncbi:hypothetical protein VVD49_18755 [Uliginosibacterium sp. H3]|uniref:Lipoprotein n=1 Tax=Uliginosibacterium silvisoli TaxID=3114758 RepID=A0ABU6K869_9RHOO|nr:hypothetical protein [Uliginosibacterium sp. H3]